MAPSDNRAALHPYHTYLSSGVQWLGDVPEHWQVVQLGRDRRLLQRIGGERRRMRFLMGYPVSGTETYIRRTNILYARPGATFRQRRPAPTPRSLEVTFSSLRRGRR